jgi:hypothetical protein
MIKLTFKYDSETIITVEDVSRLSNKNVLRKFEKAVTQQIIWRLLNELRDIRGRMEKEGVEIEYDHNSKTDDFTVTYLVTGKWKN